MTWWDDKKKEVYEKDLSANKSLFVVDEPSDEDNFGFDHYINTLEALVRECQTPFVVGLLGKWGVGKTTLVNRFLKKRLGETSGIGFVYFDAWKYQKDAFYRQFLKKMKGDLSINDDSLLIRLYKVIKRTKETGDLEVNKEEVKNLILELVAWYVGWYIFAVQFWLMPGSLISFLLPLLPAIILGLAHRLKKLVQIKKFEEEDKPLFSNEQFEEVFTEYVQKASALGKKRIVITIDNLDRCSNETAIELLGTIKTFLNVEGCVYLVPVDEDALINHLKEGLLNTELSTQDKDRQCREFLKKFFQSTIRLSPFIRGDLEKYIDKISADVSIPYKDITERENIASLVLSAYSHTPRKIKQFYNNLSANYLLAMAQEEQKNLDGGAVTGNLTFLAKLIILQEEWPKFFTFIKKDPEVLIMTEGFLRGRRLDSTHESGIKEELAKHSELGDFLQSSRSFTSKNPEQFINLKREGYEGVGGENQELSLALLTGKSELVGNLLRGGDEITKTSVVRLIENKLEEKKNQNKTAVVFNILSVIENIFPVIPDDKKGKVANKFASHLAHSSQHTNIKDFTASGLLTVLEKSSSTMDRSIIINEHVKELDSQRKLLIEYCEAYGKHYKIVPIVAHKKIAEALQNAYQYNDGMGKTYISEVLSCLKIFGRYEGALKEYVNPTLTEHLLGALNLMGPVSLDANHKQILEVLQNLISSLKENQVQHLFRNLHHVLHQKGWGPGSEEIVVFVNELVVSGKVPTGLNLEVAIQYADYINSPNIPDEHHIDFLPAIKRLITDSTDAKSHFIDLFKGFTSSLEISKLSKLFKGLDDHKITIREKLVPSLVSRLASTGGKEERESISEILKIFGTLQNGQLYMSALKDGVLLSKDFEITNHILSKVEEVRPSLNTKELNEMAPKLLEWGENLGADNPRCNTPYRFLVHSFNLLSVKNKEAVIDAWTAILEKNGESSNRKNEIGGFIENQNVIANFPDSRKDGLPRKLFDTAKVVGVDDKEVILNALISVKSFYSKKSAFIKELKGYGKELAQQQVDTQEHKLGELFLSKLG